MRIIACIEDPQIIEKILGHLNAKASEPEASLRPPCRAPPQRGLFGESGSQDDLVRAAASATRPWRRLAGKQAGRGEARRCGRLWEEFRP
jgi:hypothetical protein